MSQQLNNNLDGLRNSLSVVKSSEKLQTQIYTNTTAPSYEVRTAPSEVKPMSNINYAELNNDELIHEFTNYVNEEKILIKELESINNEINEARALIISKLQSRESIKAQVEAARATLSSLQECLKGNNSQAQEKVIIPNEVSREQLEVLSEKASLENEAFTSTKGEAFTSTKGEEVVITEEVIVNSPTTSSSNYGDLINQGVIDATHPLSLVQQFSEVLRSRQSDLTKDGTYSKRAEDAIISFLSSNSEVLNYSEALFNTFKTQGSRISNSFLKEVEGLLLKENNVVNDEDSPF